MRRHRLCTSSWVGPRRAPRPGQLRARRAACGPHRPRGPGHLKLLCRLPSRPVFPWPSEGSSKTSGLLRAHPASGRLAPRGQAGSPQRPRALAKLPLPELSRHSGALHAARSPARAQSQGQSPSPPAMPFPRPGHCPSRLLRNARPQGQESARAAGHGIGDRAAAGGLRRAQAPARQAHGPPPSAPKRRSRGARSRGRATARAPPAASWVSVPRALTAKPPSPGGDAEGASWAWSRATPTARLPRPVRTRVKHQRRVTRAGHPGSRPRLPCPPERLLGTVWGGERASRKEAGSAPASRRRGLAGHGRVRRASRRHAAAVLGVLAGVRLLRGHHPGQREEAVDGPHQIRLLRWVGGPPGPACKAPAGGERPSQRPRAVSLAGSGCPGSHPWWPGAPQPHAPCPAGRQAHRPGQRGRAATVLVLVLPRGQGCHDGLGTLPTVSEEQRDGPASSALKGASESRGRRGLHGPAETRRQRRQSSLATSSGP